MWCTCHRLACSRLQDSGAVVQYKGMWKHARGLGRDRASIFSRAAPCPRSRTSYFNYFRIRLHCTIWKLGTDWSSACPRARTPRQLGKYVGKYNLSHRRGLFQRYQPSYRISCQLFHLLCDMHTWFHRLFNNYSWSPNRLWVNSPKGEWASDSEIMRVRGIIVLVKSN